jgi:type II secretion system protein H
VPAGFTLVELLMVLVVIGIAAAISLPSFVRSIRGNRLRTAARTVVMAGKFAHSMAVMNQTEMVVIFNLDDGRISVRRAETARPRADDGETGVGPAWRAFGSAEREDAEDGDESEAKQAAASVRVGRREVVRVLDRVTIESVEIDGEDADHDGEAEDGAYTVLYRSNGRCMPYRVRIVDEEGEYVTIEVDGLASARTERG